MLNAPTALKCKKAEDISTPLFPQVCPGGGYSARHGIKEKRPYPGDCIARYCCVPFLIFCYEFFFGSLLPCLISRMHFMSTRCRRAMAKRRTACVCSNACIHACMHVSACSEDSVFTHFYFCAHVLYTCLHSRLCICLDTCPYTCLRTLSMYMSAHMSACAAQV